MEIPLHWRLKAQRYRLEGSACPTCDRLVFPPRPICPYCHAHPKLITTWELHLFPEMKQFSTTKLEIDYGD